MMEAAAMNLADDRTADDRTATRRAGRARRITHLLTGLLALPLVLGGCSAVPDWADPTGWFAEDQAPTKVGLSQGQAGYMQSTSFPNLASVPDGAPEVTPRATRAQILNSLAADRANAQYSGERLVGAAPSESPGLGATAPVQLAPGQPARVPISLIVNQVAGVEEARKVHTRIASVCARFLSYPLPMAGWISQDVRVGRSVRARRPLLLNSPNCSAAKDLRRIAAEIGAARVREPARAGRLSALARWTGLSV
ncbi:MAG: hypothetical protein IIA36_05660 [Proteobacteria bacterium]|nr:hypothetical protein [Pseudomonadota bacterium]